VNLKTAARRLGVHYQTAYRWVRGGQLVAVKVGAGYEISEAALELFHAQRAALERFPDASETTPTANTAPEDRPFTVLDRMVDAVTVDAAPVVERAARLAADVLGDGVVLSLRDDNDELTVAKVAHRDPVVEVTVSTLARDSLLTNELARAAAYAGEPIFLPQVPQRDVRRFVRRELHEHLQSVGCYSLICVPVLTDGHVDGAFLVVRNSPGRPYERTDVEFLEELAARIGLARTRARLGLAAWETRERVANAVSSAAADHDSVRDMSSAALNQLFDWAVADDPQMLVAILDLALQHVVSTKAYAMLLCSDVMCEREISLGALVTDAPSMRGSFEKLLSGEIDFCTVSVTPVASAGPIVLHAAMIRCADATPWCIVAVAHHVPQAPSRPDTGESPDTDESPVQ
jgi:excisionase family DNA binding protein